MAMVRHRRPFHRAAMKAKPMPQRFDIMPVGIVNKAEVLSLKPRLLMMMLPNVIRPPLGMLIAMLKKKMIQVRVSSNASFTCDNLNVRLTVT
jgi:hypothetical protein